MGGEARAEAVAQERVDRAHPKRAGLARPLHRLLVLEQPRQLGRGEVGVERQAAERADLLLRLAHPVEHLLGALVLPDDDRAQRRAGLGIPREHRLALVVEAARHDLVVGGLEQLAHRLHDGLEDLLTVLFHPAGLRVAVHLVAPRLAYRLEPFVEERRLDTGGALVDSEKKHGASYHSVASVRLGSPTMNLEDLRKAVDDGSIDTVLLDDRRHGGPASGQAHDGTAFPRRGSGARRRGLQVTRWPWTWT